MYLSLYHFKASCIITRTTSFHHKRTQKYVPIVYSGQARPTAAFHTPIHFHGRRDTLKMYQICKIVSKSRISPMQRRLFVS